MLLRSALGMAMIMLLMGMAQNVWQFLILRALLGLLGGFIPNANALIATQIPRQKSGWALGTLSTGGVSGALLGPLAGGLLADHYGLRPVFFITASVLFLCFLVTLICIRENFTPVAKRDAARPGCAGLAEKPKAGAESVCDHHDYPGGHRFNRAYSDALCPRFGGKRQQYRLYQRPDRLCSRCGGATERAAARQAGRPYRPGKDPICA